jgi:hypothetical protein
VINLYTELNLDNTDIHDDLRNYLYYNNKSKTLRIVNNFYCKVPVWFNNRGEPQPYLEWYEPVYNIFIVNDGVIIHRTQQNDSFNSDTTVKFIKSEVTLYGY